jgi:hypothetical protein
MHAIPSTGPDIPFDVDTYPVRNAGTNLGKNVSSSQAPAIYHIKYADMMRAFRRMRCARIDDVKL